MDDKDFYVRPKDNQISLLPFANLTVGDKILFLELKDKMYLFIERVLMEDINKLVDAKILKKTDPNDRAFIRGVFSSIQYSSVVEENYSIRINKSLIDKYNLRDGMSLKLSGHHLICQNYNLNNKKTR